MRAPSFELDAGILRPTADARCLHCSMPLRNCACAATHPTRRQRETTPALDLASLLRPQRAA